MQLDHNYFRFPSAFWSVESRPGGNSVRWSLPGDSRPRIWVRIGVRIDNICCNPLKIEGRDPQSARSKYRLVRNSKLFWPWSGSVRNLYWSDSAIKPRICKVLEKIFWGGSIIKWVILYPKHRTSGCHVIGSRDNHVSKFEVPKNVGLSFSKLGHGRKFWSKNMKSA